MRSFKAAVFVTIVYLFITDPALDAQVCIASWSGCNGNNSCTPTITIPSCNSICSSSSCRRFATFNSPPGCGNPGEACPWNVSRFIKSCNCDGAACVPPNEMCTDPESTCCQDGCNPESGLCGPGSPIMIDLASSSASYDLTSVAEGVLFDLFVEGVPVRVAWTRPNRNVALLVNDRNGNGTIDNGSELFGNFTPKSDGHLAANGFDALLDLDGGMGVSDGKMDQTDLAYHVLRLWLDRNHNGVSEAEELITLAEGGVAAIYTDYTATRKVDEHGNMYSLKGRADMYHNNKTVPRLIFDIFPKTERLD